VIAILLLQRNLPESPANPQVKRVLAEIFRDPAFRDGLGQTHGPKESLPAWILAQLARGLEAVGEWMQALRADTPWLFWLIYAVLIGLAVLLMVQIGRGLALGLRGSALRSAAARSVQGARTVRSRELREQARVLADRGEFREATGYLTLALLALFEEKHVLRGARAWTNREIFGRLRVADDFRSQLAEFERRLEAAAYGAMPIDAQTFQDLDAAVEEVSARAVGVDWRGDPQRA